MQMVKSNETFTTDLSYEDIMELVKEGNGFLPG
jgi:hypothetical protein